MKTIFWTPFLRVKTEQRRKRKRPGPAMSWKHWHADWHMIGIRVRWSDELDLLIDWISDPGYFIARKRWNGYRP